MRHLKTNVLSHAMRLPCHAMHARQHHQVGPVPRKPYVGREVVTRFASSLATAGVLFTDSQGRDYLRRVRNHRADWNLTVYQPIAGNFYPLTAGAFIADSTAQLSLLVDRPLGAASLADGQIEVMLHRRLKRSSAGEPATGGSEPGRRAAGSDAAPVSAEEAWLEPRGSSRSDATLACESTQEPSLLVDRPTAGGDESG
ncbi:unnamed protein product [Closterium sp. NIES-53]